MSSLSIELYASDVIITQFSSLCKTSDIISIHTPLNDSTRGLIGNKEIELMKDNVILYNAARGAVTDEVAVADAILSGKIAAFGCDVYSIEPFPEAHPMHNISTLDNVCLTPHMAWASFEARDLCIDEVILNINAYKNGTPRNSVN